MELSEVDENMTSSTCNIVYKADNESVDSIPIPKYFEISTYLSIYSILCLIFVSSFLLRPQMVKVRDRLYWNYFKFGILILISTVVVVTMVLIIRNSTSSDDLTDLKLEMAQMKSQFENKVQKIEKELELRILRKLSNVTSENKIMHFRLNKVSIHRSLPTLKYLYTFDNYQIRL